MPLTEKDPNVTTRSGSASTNSGNYQKGDTRAVPLRVTTEMNSAAPGVLSMLKTTTESGDIGTLPLSHARPPKINRGLACQQNGPAPIRTSSHYSRNGSIRSKASGSSLQDYTSRVNPCPPSNHADFPYASSHDLSHISSTKIRPLHHHECLRPLPITSREFYDFNRRTSSLTQISQRSRHLSSHRSVSSLRSQGPLQGVRTPLDYHAHLRRPIVSRPSSPAALSDSIATSYSRPNRVRAGIGLRSQCSTPTQHTQIKGFPVQQVYQNNNVFQDPQQSPSNHAANAFSHPTATGWRMRNNGNIHDVLQTNQMISSPTSIQAQLVNPMFVRPPQPFRPCPSPLSVYQSSTVMQENRLQRRTDSTPYAGFVQRVKHILEEKATPEGTPRAFDFDSRICTYDIPRHASELPGSLVTNRLTRDMIKASLGPSSDEVIVSSPPETFHSVIFDDRAARSSEENYSPIKTKTPDASERAKSTPDREKYQKQSESEATTTAPSSTESLRQRVHEVVQKVSLPAITEPQPEPSEVSTTEPYTKGISSSPAWMGPSLSVIHEKNLDQRISISHDVFEELDPVSRPDPQYHSAVDANTFAIEGDKSKDFCRTEDCAGDVDLEDLVSQFGSDVRSRENGMATILATQTSATTPQDVELSWSDENVDSSEIEVAKVVRISRTPRQSFDPQMLESARTGRSGVTAARSFGVNDNAVSFNSVSAPGSRRQSTRNSLVADAGDDISTGYQSSTGIADTRISVMRQFHFPLPDLTEDSQEDASTTNLRMLGAQPPIFRASEAENTKPYSKDIIHRSLKHSSEAPCSYLSRQIGHTKGIPSLHFSRTDLTSKLNVALGIRNSRSLENLQSKKTRNRLHTSLERSESSALLRTRYKSFFSDIDDGDADRKKRETAHSSTAPGTVVNENIQSETEVRREEVISELERLSIPSVNALTLRLSKLFPLLNDLNEATKYSDDENTVVEEQTDETHSKEFDVAQNTLASVISAGTAARSKRRSGVASVANDLENDVRSGGKLGILRLMKDLPPLPKETSSHSLKDVSRESNAPTRREPLLSKHQEENISELEATVPIELGERSAKVPAELPAKASFEAINELRAGRTPEDGIGTGRRLSNQGGKQPWCQDTISTSIKLPQNDNRNSGPPIPRLRGNKIYKSNSVSTLQEQEEVRIARSMSPGPHADASLIPRCSSASADIEKAGVAKKGLMESLQRKMGLKPRIDQSGFAIDPDFLHPEDRVTEPGDRYPTSGLTPPAGLNIEVENRSFFSDDSSEESRNVRASQTLKKRLTRLRGRRSASRPLSLRHSQTGSYRKASWVAPIGSANGGSVFGDSQTDVRQQRSHDVLAVEQRINAMQDEEEQPPVGMSRVEFRAKLVMHRLRKLWYKSGILLRSMSRNKNDKRQHHGIVVHGNRGRTGSDQRGEWYNIGE